MLDTVDGPADLSRLGLPELRTLAQEIRRFLVTEVSRTGGHLGPNLGVVELTIALHRVFDSPRDVLLWDTGHQAYVHKLLTGRKDFSRLRAKGGLSGYPSRSESEHDVIENSHASTALSYADGLATANRLRGFHDRCVVAVVGDGALTGGMAWEALNNIAAAKDRPLVIVVNDNERSYAPTVGGLADHLATLRTSAGYEAFLQRGKEILTGVPFAGRTLYDALHGAKKGLKDFLTPQGLFEDLGLKYVGPVDGHDLVALETALRRAKGFPGPVVVHCLTRKGKGYRPAEEHQADRLHAIGPRRAAPRATGPSWTSVFSDEIVRIGAERPDVVAITAAMREPVGLEAFAAAFPERTFDVGIAEQHAVTCAAGLAAGGMHPVVALYATFLNRAFDQVLMDVALHKAGVTFVLDRAGVTGNDGPSHHGMWDMSILQVVPGLRLAAPRDGARLRARLAEAVAVSDAPTVVRYPKGAVPDEVPAVGHVDGVDILAGSAEASADVLIVSVGAMAATAVRVGEALAGAGVSVTVVDPEWVQPVAPALTTVAGRHGLVAVLEDNVVVGGVGSVLSHTLREAHVSTPVLQFGLPRCFLPHADRSELLEEAGLTPDQISRSLLDSVTRCGLLDDRRAS
ncbi:1-deoxy-D-xylulose-5-phosphate synthase [Streptomyces sp. Go-475]|uniref:1-deoxy-D-xylulose-5-phosphate synthase n=1 Tax=Streptomyces sp. Go-475 TaxID=2072505 RepID=UPI000DEF9010|nr:1-deoxy-D-xylulose-5-phosphate synthase [Streptomyces sp. Go-475]